MSNNFIKVARYKIKLQKKKNQRPNKHAEKGRHTPIHSSLEENI